MVDISVLANYDKLETVTINECRHINNLEILEECNGLQLLKIQSVMNTGVFTKNLKFIIEITNE